MTFDYFDLCLPFTTTVVSEEFDVDRPWIAGAFLLGLFIGGGITAILAPICIRDWQKKKRQDDEETMLMDFDKDNYATATAVTTKPYQAKHIDRDEEAGKKPKNRLAAFFSRRKKDQSTYKEKTGPTGWVEPEAESEGEKQPMISQGMVTVLIKPTTAEAEAECVNQDMDAIRRMDRKLKQGKDDTMLKVLKLRLKKMKDKSGNINDPYLADFMHRVVTDQKTQQDILKTEMKEAEDEVRKKHGKNKPQLDQELDVLAMLRDQKQRKLEKDELENIRTDLLRTSGLSESEVDDLMEKYKNNLAELERRRGLEQARQARHLAERLEKRRQILEFRRLQEQQDRDEVVQETDAFSEPLEKLVTDGKLLQRQRDDLLNEHAQAMEKIQKQKEMDQLRLQQDLATKLSARREQRLRKLAEKHAKERAHHLDRAEKSSNTEEFLKTYQEMVQHQQLETEEVETELDQTEIAEMEKVSNTVEAQKDERVREVSDKFVQTVKATGQLSDPDVKRILKLHKVRMDAYEVRRREEKQRMKQKLMEKWEQRMRQLEDEDQRTATERKTLQEQQEMTVKKVLDSNLELTEDARERILREHARNMEALNNKLAHSKMTQQLVLEQKLTQRRARLAELQRQQEQIKLQNKEGGAKDVESLQEKLDLEMMMFEKEKKEAEDALRKRLAMEAEAALAQQEQDITALIGRLEVGRARRQAVLQKQDKTLKQLQEQLESRVARGGLQSQWADQIIQQHYNNVEHINTSIQQNRERQEQLINEKIQAIKFKKQRELDDQIERERQQMLYTRKQAGTGIASEILNRAYMEQRHKKAVDELEKEMQIELERSKEQLNEELQRALETELETHKGQFLNELAAASKMSKAEIEDAVNTAVLDTGGDQKAARRLSKDLQAGVQRAKSSLGMIEEDDSDPYDRGTQRPRSSVIGSRSSGGSSSITKGKRSSLTGDRAPSPMAEFEHPAPRPRSGKQKLAPKPRPVPAFKTSTGESIHGAWEMEDDDDF